MLSASEATASVILMAAKQPEDQPRTVILMAATPPEDLLFRRYAPARAG